MTGAVNCDILLRMMRPLRHDRRVKSWFWEDDTYWIELNPGWAHVDGEHAIAESTQKAAKARLADVVPCECGDCKGAAK